MGLAGAMIDEVHADWPRSATVCAIGGSQWAASGDKRVAWACAARSWFIRPSTVQDVCSALSSSTDWPGPEFPAAATGRHPAGLARASHAGDG